MKIIANKFEINYLARKKISIPYKNTVTMRCIKKYVARKFQLSFNRFFLISTKDNKRIYNETEFKKYIMDGINVYYLGYIVFQDIIFIIYSANTFAQIRAIINEYFQISTHLRNKKFKYFINNIELLNENKKYYQIIPTADIKILLIEEIIDDSKDSITVPFRYQNRIRKIQLQQSNSLCQIKKAISDRCNLNGKPITLTFADDQELPTIDPLQYKGRIILNVVVNANDQIYTFQLNENGFQATISQLFDYSTKISDLKELIYEKYNIPMNSINIVTDGDFSYPDDMYLSYLHSSSRIYNIEISCYQIGFKINSQLKILNFPKISTFNPVFADILPLVFTEKETKNEMTDYVFEPLIQLNSNLKSFAWKTITVIKKQNIELILKENQDLKSQNKSLQTQLAALIESRMNETTQTHQIKELQEKNEYLLQAHTKEKQMIDNLKKENQCLKEQLKARSSQLIYEQQQYAVLKKMFNSIQNIIRNIDGSLENVIDLSNYEIADTLYSHNSNFMGSFGQIIKIRHSETNKIYALKRMQHGFINDDVCDRMCLQRQFFREYLILSLYKYPSIVPFVGVSLTTFEYAHNIPFPSYQSPVDYIKPCFIFDFIEPGSLEQLIYERKRKNIVNQLIKPYDSTAQMKIIAGVVKAMEYLHSRNVIHRDLKPSNILVDQDYHSYLIDFGLSRHMNGKDKELSFGIGTPFFLPPEMYDFDSTYTSKVDIFSFGMVLFGVCTGFHPFELYPEFPHLNAQNVFNFLNRNKYQPKYPENCEIPPKFIELIDKCVSINPNDRPTFEDISKWLSQPDNVLYNTNITEYKEYLSSLPTVVI